VGQQVIITAPEAVGPEQPLRLVFEIAASSLPAGTTAANLDIFRNGTRVPGCTGPAGHAVPNPCVESRETLPGGNLSLSVLTVAASRWNFGKSTAPEPDPNQDSNPGQTTPQDQQEQPGQREPSGETPAADTRAPTSSVALVAKQTIRTLIAKGLRVTVSCDEACTTRIDLLIDRKTGKRLKLKTRLARKTVQMAAAGSRKVAIKLPAKAKKKLKKLKSLKVRVRTTAVDGAGNRALPQSRAVKLRR
jgi:hypothetical protein